MPNVEPDALERLAREAGVDRPWIELAPTNDEAAAEVVREAEQSLSDHRRRQSFEGWFLVAVWIAGGSVVAYWRNGENPVEVWYWWPLQWIGSVFIFGTAVTVVYGVTLLLHYAWWNRFGREGRGRFWRLPFPRKRPVR